MRKLEISNPDTLTITAEVSLGATSRTGSTHFAPINDLVNGFSSNEGDRLDMQGQTYITTTDANGNAVLTLPGGGMVTLASIAANQVNVGFFV